MRLVLKTEVDQPLPTVWAGFNRTLFDQLSPPFPPVRVVRFDGCLQGDVVHLQLNFLLFRQDWISLIVDQQTTDDEIYFIDKGTRLPFFLTYWQHRHRLVHKSSDNHTVIIDDITFRTPFLLIDYLLYPVMWLQFTYRKPIYHRFFSKEKNEYLKLD
jgi:ligand-binding SRPBCC domain-containing protein